MNISVAEYLLHKVDFVPSSSSRGRRHFRVYVRQTSREFPPVVGAGGVVE